MLLEDLKELVCKGESEHLEFKKTTGQKNEALKTVCAFLVDINQQGTRQDARQDTRQDEALLTEIQDKILQFCAMPRSAREIMSHICLKDRESFYKVYLQPLLKTEFLLMTVPNKPKSKNQKYYSNKKNKRQDFF